MELPYGSVIPFLAIYVKKPETLIQKNIRIPMFIVALFTIAKVWKQPKCPSVDEWIKHYGTFTQQNTIQPKKKKKEENFTLRDSMDRLGDYCAQ